MQLDLSKNSFASKAELLQSVKRGRGRGPSVSVDNGNLSK